MSEIILQAYWTGQCISTGGGGGGDYTEMVMFLTFSTPL